jgi:hypothetical protein
MIWMDANMFGSCDDLGLKANEINIHCYPNPSSAIINIVSEKLGKNNQLVLYDMSGKLVLQQKLTPNPSQVNISELKNGIYLLEIQENNQAIYHEKFIKN